VQKLQDVRKDRMPGTDQHKGKGSRPARLPLFLPSVSHAQLI
jgi:hypothetical protein